MFECSICEQGMTAAGTTTVTLEHGAKTIVIEEVPAEICQNCGECFVSEETAEEVMRRGEFAADSDQAHQVLRFAA